MWVLSNIFHNPKIYYRSSATKEQLESCWGGMSEGPSRFRISCAPSLGCSWAQDEGGAAQAQTTVTPPLHPWWEGKSQSATWNIKGLGGFWENAGRVGWGNGSQKDPLLRRDAGKAELKGVRHGQVLVDKAEVSLAQIGHHLLRWAAVGQPSAPASALMVSQGPASEELRTLPSSEFPGPQVPEEATKG